MFRMRLGINQTMLGSLKTLKPRAERIFRSALQTDLKPELQREVDALLTQPPGQVSDPFEFASENSHLYYLILIRKNPDLVDDEHWKRTLDIGKSFEVRIGSQFRENMISVTNILSQSTGTKPYPAQYVYDPYAVAGHINTGWQEQAKIARQILRGKATSGMYQLWSAALHKAAKGKD